MNTQQQIFAHFANLAEALAAINQRKDEPVPGSEEEAAETAPHFCDAEFAFFSLIFSVLERHAEELQRLNSASKGATNG